MSDAGDAPIWEPWYQGKTFTTDWSTRAFMTWMKHLSHLRPYPIRILEIGSWEGRSTLFFLNYFPESTITCMDIFTLGNEPLFDANVMAGHSDRVTKLRGQSVRLLDDLAASGEEHFDLIYIDGSHERDDVMIDSILSWRLLKETCFLIWDDYMLLEAMRGQFDDSGDPRPAINTFMDWHKDEIRTIDVGYQVIVQKRQKAAPAAQPEE